MKRIKDNRVHLMLYFFGSGHHTNASDFTILQRFQRIVNIIPCVAKADSFVGEEMSKIKLDIITNASDRDVKFFDCDGAITMVANPREATLLREVFLNH